MQNVEPGAEPGSESGAELTFRRRLKEMRDSQRLSQAGLAARLATRCKLELDPTAITRIERGTRSISLTEAAAIAYVLGASVDDMCRTTLGESLRAVRHNLAKTVQEAELIEETLTLSLSRLQLAREREERLKKMLATLEENTPAQEDAQAANIKAVVVRPRAYDEALRLHVAELSRAGRPVSIDITDLTQQDKELLWEFVTGLMFAQHGHIVDGRKESRPHISLRAYEGWNIPEVPGEDADGPR